jgi:hypothetical protein
MERRNFIRALIAVAIGVPIAVEGATFSKLFYERLVGSGGQSESEGGVDVGGELLPGSPAADTIAEMSMEATSETEWRFRLVVEIENTAQEPYRLKLGPLSLADDSTVGETISSGDIPPGKTATMNGEWTLSSGSIVEGIWAGGKTGSESVTERVPLARVEPPE